MGEDMKEHPILFSTEMVRAIRDGLKTQTRRVIKDQPSGPDIFPPNGYETNDTWFFRDAYYADEQHPNIGKYVKCPYGVKGNRLWVRETWAHDDIYCKDVACGNRDHIWWKANENKITADSFAGAARWRPSIHMPRWASRLTLEIVDIRVERVQAITRADARAEGVSHVWTWSKERNETNPEYFARGVLNPYVANYSVLWDSINAKRGYGWDVNPWVWVIEFKKV